MLSRRLFTGLAVAAALAVAPGAALAADTIAIAQFGPHPQLDAVVTAFKAELAAQGYTEGDKLQPAVRSSPYPFLQKPFSPENLAVRIRDALDRTGR